MLYRLKEEIPSKLMPDIQQVQNYVKYRRYRMGDNSNMEGVKSFENTNKFHSHLQSNQIFCFGVQLGKGTDDNKMRFGLTSKKLLENCVLEKGVFHIDLTYKIIKQSYPLLVFGCYDISGQFHPIALMFLSHWELDDFEHFFKSLLNILEILNITFKPLFIMQDADKACYNAIKSILQNTTVLMCYFHVLQNVRKK